MISVIVYGRNDNHGYNLPKRAAISLNCIAEMLNGAGDEILFVDYNTPDDLPTFPEAIADTLTRRARERLRIIRVRAAFHRLRFGDRTHLAALEPIARNIALRRSNPENRWVLSTNTDMIFVPQAGEADLTRIAACRPDGFYHLPRFELPEALWEGFDRADPAGILGGLRDMARRYHLEEIVFGDPGILYDGPGDFQLCLRQDLFAIDGFDEDMLLGWHVDSNLATRLSLLRGAVKHAADHLSGYHCDHTRQPTVLHASGRRQNDLGRFVDRVREPALPGQRASWGFPDIRFEEIRLGESDNFVRYRRALDRAIAGSQQKPYVANYRSEGWNKFDCPADHVAPYVTDIAANLPADTVVTLDLCDNQLLHALGAALSALLPAGRLLVPRSAPCLNGGSIPGCFEAAEFAECLAASQLLVFEFSSPLPGLDAARDSLGGVHQDLLTALADERKRLATDAAARRRFVVVNAVNSVFEATVEAGLDTAAAPYSSRIRHGFARRQEQGS